jgi:hypothetical protein
MLKAMKNLINQQLEG